MKGVSALLAGALFGAGLALSGMADPQNVLAFLVLSADWSPALIGTMGSALLVTAGGYAVVTRRSRPLFAEAFSMPDSTVLDGRLIGGGSLFGVGWGLSGYCPGPGIVGLAVLDVRAVAFLAAFLVGMMLYERLFKPGATNVSAIDHVASDG